MRAFLVIILVVLGFGAQCQSSVSPGIIAYTSGAHERALQLLNEAFQIGGMGTDARSKAHYYRGMSRLSLLKAGSRSTEIGSDPYLAVYNDLSRAAILDNQWQSSVQSEMGLIHRRLVEAAQRSYDQGVNSYTENEINRLFGSAIEKLTAARQINSTFQVNDLLGRSHDAIGIFYDQLIDQADANDKALAAYRSAQQFYEAALVINPRSIESVRALKQLAYRFGNRDEEVRYAKMEADLGG